MNNEQNRKIPDKIEVRGARVHNLKNIDVDIPLQKITAIAGVSGSGKSSLAAGVLYAEGSRRYLQSLSTYTRRRMSQAAKADVDEVRYVPAALALRQRPGVPSIRSTFGTSTELLNSLRLLFSRCSVYKCPNGHDVGPTLNVALEKEIVCPVCGEPVIPLGAEELAFNSAGACEKCEGTGVIRTVDEESIVPDDSLSIDEGAVAPWQSLMWSLMKDIAREMGVRTDVPFRDLTEEEKEIVFHGPAEKKHILYTNEKTNTVAEMDFTYFNAVYTVENALSKVKDEKGMKRVEKFLKQEDCPACHGTRLNEKARSLRVCGESLDHVCTLSLRELCEWVKGVPEQLDPEMRNMASAITEEFLHQAERLMDLGLSYLSLDRASETLSTGERQRTQLARSVRNRTTGVLYVLDEPSIGLHPSNIEGLKGVMDDLMNDGNSIILVDHEPEILRHSDWLIEMGPEAGAKGGLVINEGTIDETIQNPVSMIGPFLKKDANKRIRPIIKPENMFEQGEISMETRWIHTVKPLSVSFPKRRLCAVTGVSGSGKTTMILESLIPALQAKLNNHILPHHVVNVEAEGIHHIKLIDASPIGVNVRSTVATYANVHDELRKVYGRLKDAKAAGYKAGDFSYNTGRLRCLECDGTGVISLDVQFLPDVEIDCPSCKGSRYSKEAQKFRRISRRGNELSLPQLMEMTVDEALTECDDLKVVFSRLQTLHGLGLGYLKLSEETPGLSGGEAQRLKLAGEMGKVQSDSIFVFDEPTIGLHPLDVRVLMKVFDSLIDQGATVIVIEHDLDLIRNADYIVDMGPGGGKEGGMIVFAGTPDELRNCERSQTAKYL